LEKRDAKKMSDVLTAHLLNKRDAVLEIMRSSASALSKQRATQA
jgi:hypothetical protein